MRRVFILLALASLLFSLFPHPTLAQDEPDTDPNNSSQLFLPFVGGNQGNRVNLSAADLSIASESISVESTEAAATEKFQSRRLPAEALKPVSVIVVFGEGANPAQVEAISGGRVIHRYDKIFNGVSMLIPVDNVETVEGAPGVVAVYPDELLQLETYASPAFIGAPAAWNALGGQDRAGEGVVVGILDSGIWPENPSFADDGSYPAPAVNVASCDFGNTGHNSNDAPFTCNNKLIGAYRFMATYDAFTGILPYEFRSARDDDGHGTHTASTAAGNAHVAVNLLGNDLGTISGIAPRAHLVAYKVCGQLGCYSSDSAAAIEQAIADGVDVLNFSISGGANPYNDAVGLAFLSAYANNIYVAASAGNAGPGANTVNHRGPWIMTVGASTIDKGFFSTATLVGPNGALQIRGATLTQGISTPTEVVQKDGDPGCLNRAEPGTLAGKIVACERGVIARVAKSENVAAGGAVGLFLYNPSPQGVNTDLHSIPTIHFESGEGAQLLAFLAANPGATATFPAGAPDTQQGDVMAGFSSRGGAGLALGVAKPDITGPGVNILAAYTELEYGTEVPGYNFLSGTSMSSPHLAGAGALLKAMHPSWTPGQIKSAIMLSAKSNGVYKEDGVTPADPFDMGSGRIDLNRAGSVSLTLDESAANYVTLQNQLWKANYPSLYVPVMQGQISVQRTLRNVTNRASNWQIDVVAPADVIVNVPKNFNVPPGQTSTLNITVDARTVPGGEVRHAALILRNKHSDETLRFPITIVRRQGAVTAEKSCTPAQIARGNITTCTITLANASFSPAYVSMVDALPDELRLVDGSIVNGSRHGQRVTFEGTLAPAQPADVTVAIAPLASPAGYLPLANFGISPISSVGDESIVNFNVPSFTYAGETYSRIGVVSNGYIVIGGGTGGDVQFINTDLPDATPPNNVLAPFWTDLNPAFGGRMLIATLCASTSQCWIVVEWENVVNYGDRRPNTFQVWIGYGAADGDISFTYGPNISDGDGGFLTVGAENRFGNRGGTVYYDGVGIAPMPSSNDPSSYEVKVTTGAPVPGEAATISYQARGHKAGQWLSCAETRSNLFDGVNTACARGEVMR